MSCTIGSIQLKNVTAMVYLLPKDKCDVADITRTITVDAAIAEGSETIQLSAGQAFDLPAGTGIAVQEADGKYKQVLVKDAATLGSGSTQVTIYASLDAIAAGSTGVFYEGMKTLNGIQEFGYQTSPTEVDTTTTLSGTGTQNDYVRQERSINLEGVASPEDEGYWKILVPVADKDAYFGRQLYLLMSYPNGLTREGVVKVTDFSEPGGKDEVFKYSMTVKFQGQSYKRNDPYGTL